MRFFIKRIRSGSLSLLLVTLLSTCASAGGQSGSSASAFFYDSRPKEGWYWYHDPVVTPDKPKQQQDEVLQQAPAAGKYTEKELYDMYPDQFQELLKVRLKTAVQYPTEENVEDYIKRQDIARRKAAAFTAAVQFVTQKDAARYSMNGVYPATTPGIEARVQMEQREIFDTISTARNDHAILFFWKPGCGYCEKQVGILKYFTEKYGWQIKPIDITKQTDLAARFNITVTPTLLLIQQGNEKFMPLSVGVVSLAEMEQNLYRAIRYMNGDTDIETFTNTDYEKGGPLDPRSILKGGSL